MSPPASEDVALRHDVQASAPRVHVSLTRAGVTGIQSVIRIAHGGKERLYAAQLECTVDLDPAHKGVHMSRFPEQIGESIERLVIGESLHVEELASAIARETLGRQGALRSQVRIEAIQSTTRTAPRSGLASQEISTLIGVATASAKGTRRAVGVRVRGITACPCAQGMVRDHADERLAELGYGAEERERILDTVPIATHNQRGEATLLLGTREHVPAERLAAIAERSMSAPILTLLKRADELHVVEQAHANPRFVEDVVREMVAGVVEDFPELEDDAFVQARQLNFETIHAHDVLAERTGLAGRAAARAGRRRRRRPRLARRLAAQLAHRAVGEVRGGGALDDLRAFERHLGTVQIVEQPRAAAEQHGDEVDPQLVEQPGLEVLLGDVRPAAQVDVLAAGRLARLRQRRLDAVGDEVEGGAALHHERLARVVREDEDRRDGRADRLPTSRSTAHRPRTRGRRTCSGP